jgi:ABC-2 type transport system ATP-binding protein
MSVIRLEGVEKIYRKSHLGRVRETVGVSDVSLEIPRGEVFGLLGLNGAGKSTTIKLILGLHRPTRGKVSLLDRAMPDVGILSRVGYLPEGAYLSRELTGRESVAFFAHLSGVPAAARDAAVRRTLERVGMAEAADDRAGEYSKGMLQRISMAQALVHDPEVLVLDEPGTGLDPMATKQLREMILWLKRKGRTVLLSSHSISEVEQVCDRIGILSEGRLVRTARQDEWQGSSLEELFLSAVSQPRRVSPMRFD